MNKKRGLFSPEEIERRHISSILKKGTKENNKINDMLLDAQTGEETKKFIEMGGDVNFTGCRYKSKYDIVSQQYTPLSVADVEQAIILINSGANIEQLNENKYLSDKEKLEVLNGIDYKKLTGKDIEDIEQIQIHIEIKQRIAKAKEAIAKRDGIVEQPQSTSHDSNSPTPSKPNGRDDGGR